MQFLYWIFDVGNFPYHEITNEQTKKCHLFRFAFSNRFFPSFLQNLQK